MRVSCLLFIVFILSLSSCKGKEMVAEPILQISFSESGTFIKDHFTKFHCVQLELNDDCAIAEIRSIQDVEGSLYVLTSNDQLLVFNKEGGRFIRRIGNRGEGPDDYLNIKDFFLSTDNKLIGLVDGMSNSIKYYTTSGKFDHELKLNESLAFWQNSELLSDNQLLSSHEIADPTYTDQYAYSVLDLKSSATLLKFDNTTPVMVKGYSTPFARKPTTRNSDGITFFKFLNDTIFHISNDNIISPIYKLKFDAPMLTKKDLAEMEEPFTQGRMFNLSMRKGYISGMDKIYETRNIIALYPFSAPFKDGIYFISKNTGKGYHIPAVPQKSLACRNILDFTNFPDFVGSNEDELICILPSNGIADMKAVLSSSSNQYPFKELENVVKASNVECNPILVFYEH